MTTAATTRLDIDVRDDLVKLAEELLAMTPPRPKPRMGAIRPEDEEDPSDREERHRLEQAVEHILDAARLLDPLYIGLTTAIDV